MKIELDSSELSYTGRIDFSNLKKPEFIFPSSSVEIHFIGKGLVLNIVNKNDYYRNFIGTIIDGDSIPAGELTKAIEYVGKQDPEHEGRYSNSW